MFIVSSGLLSPRTFPSQRQGRYDCGFKAEMRESTPTEVGSYQQVTVRGGALSPSRLEDQPEGCLQTSNERHA